MLYRIWSTWTVLKPSRDATQRPHFEVLAGGHVELHAAQARWRLGVFFSLFVEHHGVQGFEMSCQPALVLLAIPPGDFFVLNQNHDDFKLNFKDFLLEPLEPLEPVLFVQNKKMQKGFRRSSYIRFVYTHDVKNVGVRSLVSETTHCHRRKLPSLSRDQWPWTKRWSRCHRLQGQWGWGKTIIFGLSCWDLWNIYVDIRHWFFVVHLCRCFAAVSDHLHIFWDSTWWLTENPVQGYSLLPDHEYELSVSSRTARRSPKPK